MSTQAFWVFTGWVAAIIVGIFTWWSRDAFDSHISHVAPMRVPSKMPVVHAKSNATDAWLVTCLEVGAGARRSAGERCLVYEDDGTCHLDPAVPRSRFRVWPEQMVIRLHRDESLKGERCEVSIGFRIANISGFPPAHVVHPAPTACAHGSFAPIHRADTIGHVVPLPRVRPEPGRAIRARLVHSMTSVEQR